MASLDPMAGPVTLRSIAARFPNRAIVSNPTLERWIINWVWVTVPLQYYLLTRPAGGMRGGQWLAIVVSVAACMLLILAVSAVLALILPMKDSSDRELKLRAWSVALVTLWTATVTLLAASHFVAWLFGQSQDLIHVLICAKAGLTCTDHPSLGALTSFLIYFVYAVMAMGLVLAVLKRTGGTPAETRFPAPYTLAVILICTVLLNLLYSASKLH